MNRFTGTKEIIFDTFIEMISQLGYENVSIRDIAEKVGIKASSIYNHFDSKEQLLTSTYDYYWERLFENRKPADMMKKLIEEAGAEEIIDAFSFTFESEDQKKYIRMILISKIIFMRLFQDPAAYAMFAEAGLNNAEYTIGVLKHGIEKGRIDPDFDIVTFADHLRDSITIMGIKALANPSYILGQLEQENRIKALLARLLSTAMK